MKSRVNVPRLVMLIHHYTTYDLELVLDRFKEAEADLNARMKDTRLKPWYRRRALVTLRTVMKERTAVENELERRPDRCVEQN